MTVILKIKNCHISTMFTDPDTILKSHRQVYISKLYFAETILLFTTSAYFNTVFI